jgi:hypothetical protein
VTLVVRCVVREVLYTECLEVRWHRDYAPGRVRRGDEGEGVVALARI